MVIQPIQRIWKAIYFQEIVPKVFWNRYAIFKGVNAYAGLLPYGNYKTLLYNFDKLRAASRVSALYSDYVPKPELLVSDFSGVNIYKLSGKPAVLQKGSYVHVASRSMDGDNEQPFIVGQSPVQYKYPFRRGVNKRVQVEWRAKYVIRLVFRLQPTIM